MELGTTNVNGENKQMERAVLDGTLNQCVRMREGRSSFLQRTTLRWVAWCWTPEPDPGLSASVPANASPDAPNVTSNPSTLAVSLLEKLLVFLLIVQRRQRDTFFFFSMPFRCSVFLFSFFLHVAAECGTWAAAGTRGGSRLFKRIRALCEASLCKEGGSRAN